MCLCGDVYMTIVSRLVMSSRLRLLLNLNRVLSAVSALVILRRANIVASRTAVRRHCVVTLSVVSSGRDYNKHYGRIMGFNRIMASSVMFVFCMLDSFLGPRISYVRTFIVTRAVKFWNSVIVRLMRLLSLMVCVVLLIITLIVAGGDS